MARLAGFGGAAAARFRSNNRFPTWPSHQIPTVETELTPESILLICSEIVCSIRRRLESNFLQPVKSGQKPQNHLGAAHGIVAASSEGEIPCFVTLITRGNESGSSSSAFATASIRSVSR